MDFKLIENSGKDLSTVETILTNRGIKIEDIPSYLSASDDAILDRKLIDNLVEGVDLLLKHLNAGIKFSYRLTQMLMDILRLPFS